MRYQQSRCRLLELPPELRLMIYEHYMFHPEPIPYAGVERAPPSIRALWQTCKVIRKETRHRDDFVRLNTFGFRSLDTMGAFIERASAHTRGLLLRVRLDLTVTVPNLGSPTFKHYEPDSDSILIRYHRPVLPNLREMAVNTQGFEKLGRPEEGSWMQTLEAERDARYDAFVEMIVGALPVLPTDISLRIVGTMPDHKLGFGWTGESLRKRNMVHFTVVYRSRGHAGWHEESMEEIAPPDMRLKELDKLRSVEFGHLRRRVTRRRESDVVKRWSTFK